MCTVHVSSASDSYSRQCFIGKKTQQSIICDWSNWTIPPSNDQSKCMWKCWRIPYQSVCWPGNTIPSTLSSPQCFREYDLWNNEPYFSKSKLFSKLMKSGRKWNLDLWSWEGKDYTDKRLKQNWPGCTINTQPDDRDNANEQHLQWVRVRFPGVSSITRVSNAISPSMQFSERSSCRRFDNWPIDAASFPGVKTMKYETSSQTRQKRAVHAATKL